MPGAPGLSEITTTTQRNRGATKAPKRKPVGGYRAPPKPPRKPARRSK